jgi:hypothetical protein
MFRKVKINKNQYKLNRLDDHEIDTDEKEYKNESNLNLHENDEEKNASNLENQIKQSLEKIKAEIDKKSLKKKQNFQFKSDSKDDKIYQPFKKEESRENSVKKVFISELQLKEAKNPDEKKKLLGMKREEYDKIKEEKKRGLINMQKELFTLPNNLQAHPTTKNDHVENLIRLSTAGLIEVPLPLEQKLRSIEEANNKHSTMDNKLAEELDYLKVLKKIGPSYAKGYKSDLSHKKISKLNNIFENVFVAEKSRKRKLLKQKIVLENRRMEEF